MKEIKSNLRWAGGKSKMIKILDNFFPKNINKYLETFIGGGSVLLHIIQKYNPKVIYANDINQDLINYYNYVQNYPQILVDDCLKIKSNYTKETFATEFTKLNRDIASDFFISNKTSFSGLNYNYSQLAYDRNFTINSINKIMDISNIIQNVNFINEDFINLENTISEIKDYFIYLDPPYYSNKDKGLYGKKGELHKNFNHLELFNFVNRLSETNQIMISYDDDPYIRELYKDYNIYNFDFVYSMTNVGGNLCKVGKEIVITNYKVE